MMRILAYLMFLAVSASCFAVGQSVIQKDFEQKFVGYKMDPFLIQESKECLMEPYIPTFGSFNIFDGPVYKKKTTTSTVN